MPRDATLRLVPVLVFSLVVACAPATPQAQGPAAPLAANESTVTARVEAVRVVDAASLGMAPPQPICVLTLRVLSSGAGETDRSAVRGAEQTVTAYAKDISLARLLGHTIVARVTRRGSERGERLWITRLISSSSPP